MPRFNRPIGHDERLSLVEHLEELRGRIIVSLVGLGLVFALCFWQANAILDFVNAPLERASIAEPGEPGPDPLQQNLHFNRQIADALQATAPSLEGLGGALSGLAAGGSLRRAERRALAAAAAELESAASVLRDATASVPEAG